MKITKILLVGHFSKDPKIYTYASSFYKAFKNLGYKTETFNYKNTTFKMPIFGKILLHHSLIKTVKRFSPDLIFMLKADNIQAKTLKKIKQHNNPILVNFYPDNPFTFWNGNSNEQVLRSLPIYDSFLIWSHQLIPILYSAGAKNVQFFPFAFDQSLFSQDIAIAAADTQKYKSDVCFVGSWDAEREMWLTQLMQKMPQLNLAIWGNRWNENLPQNSILRPYLKGYAIYGIDMMKSFRLCKIVLNFIRKQNLDAHNMRTIEVAACRGFLLTQRTTDQAERLFKEGENIECFDRIDELVAKISYYLLNDSKREEIIRTGHKKVQEYSIEKVLCNILTILVNNSWKYEK